MKGKFIFSGQDVLDFINETVSTTAKLFRRQSLINKLTYLSLLNMLIIGFLQSHRINNMQKEIEELKRPEGE